MASGTAWYFPPASIGGRPNTDARTQSIAPYGLSKIAIAGYAPTVSGATLFTFDTSAQTWSSLLNAGATSAQYTGVASAASSGIATVGADGFAASYSSTGATLFATAPNSSIYKSTFTNGASGFAADSYGSLYSVTSSHTHLGSVTPTSGSQIVPATANYNSGANFLGVIAALGQIGMTNSSGAYSSTLAGPSGVSILSCIATTGTNIFVGGYSSAAFGATGQNIFNLNPVNTALLLGVSSSAASIFTQSGTYSDVWSLSASVSGITNSAVSVAWSTNGTQAFLADTANSALQIINYTAGTLSIAQTLTLSGALSVATASDSVSAIVSQSGLNQVEVYKLSGATWGAATTLAVSGASQVAAQGANILVGSSTGVAVLTENAGTWSVASTIVTGFAVTALTVDAYGVAYAANATNIAVIKSGAVVGTGTFAGSSAKSISVFQNQVAILDSTAGLVRIIGSNDGITWSQFNTITATGGTNIYQASRSVFVSASATGVTLIDHWDSPYKLVNAKTGYVGLYNGSSWISASLGVDKVPSAVSIDPSGNYWCACDDNSLYELNSSFTITQTTTVPNYPGMSTPLGVSSLSFAYGHLYAGSSLFGGLTQVF